MTQSYRWRASKPYKEVIVDPCIIDQVACEQSLSDIPVENELQPTENQLKVIKKISKKDMKIINWYTQDGLSMTEIASKLHISKQAVDKRFKNIQKKAKEALKELEDRRSIKKDRRRIRE